MKIKRLELSGFKSFVERTVINFEHEVMAIVGPNGCGKSNIVDAIRWCMGEQSAKHLRGRSMEDVIFSGSESRPASDLAEVTLTFENNTPEEVPLEYRDYAEIAITRRIYRTGESEYLINKTQVRLKDVTDLFLGTGVGTKAYSIVEQGKIGLIVSAKPEDRRILIEEAAGITKFKSRKKQAERKMELTQQNLLRVGDIIAEIERNLGTLKRQATKAERYLAHRTEVEDLQLYESSHRYLELTGWVTYESSEVESAQVALETARGSLTAAEGELELLRQQAHELEVVLDEHTGKHFATENEVRSEESLIERAQDRIATERAREKTAREQVSSLTEQRETLFREQETLAEEVRALEAEAATFEADLAAEEAKLAELELASDEVEARTRALRETLSTTQANIASAEATLGAFDRRKEEWAQRKAKLAAEEEELAARLLEHAARQEQYALAIEDLRQGRVTSADEKARMEVRLTELKQEIIGSDKALDEAKQTLGKSRSRLQALSEVAARLDGVGSGAKALLATGDQVVRGLVADRIDAPHELVSALAALLGSRLEEVVVTDEARGLELLESLRESKKGRATIIPAFPRGVAGAMGVLPNHAGVLGRFIDKLRYDESDEPLVHALLGDAILVRDVAAALELRSQTGASLVTLDGTVIQADGRISGGTGEQLAEGLLETKHEIRALEVTVAKYDALVTERVQAHQMLRQEIASTQGALERARQQAHEDELALVHAEKDLTNAGEALERMHERQQALAAEAAEVQAGIEEAEREREGLTQAASEAREAHVAASQELESAEAEANEWRSQVSEQRGHVTDRKVRAKGAEEKLSASRGTHARLGRSAEELAERLGVLDHELEQAAESFGEAVAAVVKHKERLTVAQEAARLSEATLVAARREFNHARSVLSERDASLKDLRGEVDRTKEEWIAHEMRLKERVMAKQHLLESVREKFRGLDLTRIVGDYHLRPPPTDETKSRIAELIHVIDRMGSVNLDAMREHAEAEERYTYYTTQKADLDQALSDLEKAIAQMNRETKRLFQETFDAVNARFQEIFPRMFRGGRAALRLTNADDMLETGIDILAQPPGKKLASIELMSGGEKALTAVSLIFAIFQIKPSPFCILDEVDAPLDEANVARYNEMIRAMTDRSQFILITHIKRTMQLVDVLHGVTMQESGVSRLVSVKLSEAAEKKAGVEETRASVA